MITIYVALLDEGTNVWRLVPAETVGPNLYRIAPDAPYNRADERWQFEPGEQVRCERRTLADGAQTMVAVERVISP